MRVYASLTSADRIDGWAVKEGEDVSTPTDCQLTERRPDLIICWYTTRQAFILEVACAVNSKLEKISLFDSGEISRLIQIISAVRIIRRQLSVD